MVIKKGTEIVNDKILESSYPAGFMCEKQEKMYMLWFNFILVLNFISLCFKHIIINYHAQRQKGNKI